MHRRPTALLPALVVLPLLLAACGSSAGDVPLATSTSSTSATSSAAPTSTPSVPVRPASRTVTSLEQARAAWTASPASKGEYQLRVVRSCFCLQLGVQSQVRAGTVVATDWYRPDDLGASASPSPDPSFPRTVEDLFDLVAGAADAHRAAVVYSRDGVPLRIEVDPIENAVDDESSYAVSFSTMEGEPEPAAADGAWRAADPSGQVPALGGSGLPETGALAYVDPGGAEPVLRLGLWGSGSCPDRPVTLGAGSVQDGVVAVTVAVDGTQPAGRACTADYGPTWYAAPLPPALDDVLRPAGSAGPVVRLVLESVGGSPGSTGSSARAVDVLR